MMTTRVGGRTNGGAGLPHEPASSPKDCLQSKSHHREREKLVQIPWQAGKAWKNIHLSPNFQEPRHPVQATWTNIGPGHPQSQGIPATRITTSGSTAPGPVRTKSLLLDFHLSRPLSCFPRGSCDIVVSCMSWPCTQMDGEGSGLTGEPDYTGYDNAGPVACL